MASGNDSGTFAHRFCAATQDFGEDRHVKVFGKSSQVNGKQHVTAHGVHIAHGIGCRNCAEGKGVIYDRREKNYRRDDNLRLVCAIRCVIGMSVRADPKRWISSTSEVVG